MNRLGDRVKRSLISIHLNKMKNTLYPEIIYGAFERYGFPVLRIDHFDRGDYAEIRAELDYPGFLSVKQLQEITMKLNLMERTKVFKFRLSMST